MRLGRAGGIATGAAAAACALARIDTFGVERSGAPSRSARLPLAARTSRHGKTVSILLAALFSTTLAAAPTPPQTPIDNVATLAWSAAGEDHLTLSNAVRVTTEPANTTVAAVSALRFVAGGTLLTRQQKSMIGSVGTPLCFAPDGTTTAMPSRVFVPGAGEVDLASGAPIELVLTPAFRSGEPVFLRIVDADHNLDPAVVDRVTATLSVDRTSDEERLSLAETGPDTGEFIGYIQSRREAAVSRDCSLAIDADSRVKVVYDDFERVESELAVLVDPFGRAFDALTGALLDGVTVELVDADTGLPAQVRGDDGVSLFPSAVVTGGRVTDASGREYQFEPGSYRFPYTPAGNLRLVVTPPVTHVFPTSLSDAAAAAAPGGPWAVTSGARGDVFIADSGPPLHIDLPLDRLIIGLLVRASASQEIVGLGDFVRISVDVTNTHSRAPALGLAYTQELPAGFRVLPGSVRFTPPAGTAGPSVVEPAADGRSLRFPLPVLLAGESGHLEFTVEVVAGVATGSQHARGLANAEPDVVSNPASLPFRVRDDLMQDAGTLMGEVLSDACGAEPGSATGVPGVRLLMEDGSYVITDARGRYTFRGVPGGTHVVQLDTATVPEGYELVACGADTRSAGWSRSRFVELSRGGLARADFHLRRLSAPQGELQGRLAGRLVSDDVAEYRVELAGTDVPVSNLRVSVLLPDGADLVAGSVTQDGATLGDALAEDGVMTLRLGAPGADWTRTLVFRARLATGDAQKTRVVATFDTPSATNQRLAPLAVSLRATTRAALSEQRTLRLRFVSGSAALTRGDREQIESALVEFADVEGLRFEVTGHTDDVPISAERLDEYADNTALSLARAQAVARHIGGALGLGPDRFTTFGAGSSAPVGDNRTIEGRAINRRVELRILGLAPAVAGDASASAGPVSAQLTGVRPGAPAQPVEAPVAASNYAPYAKPLDAAFLASLDATPAILWPDAQSHPAIAAVRVAAKHARGQKLVLRVGGAVVSGLNLAGTHSGAGDVVVTEWTGVPVREGTNAIEVDVLDAAGTLLTTLHSSVHYAGRGVRAEFVPERSRLVADGREPPVLAVRVFDRWDRPVRPGITGEFVLAQPHQAYQSVADLQQRQLFAAGSRTDVYSVGEDGIALIKLMPTTQSGQVQLTLRFAERQEQEVRAWLTPEAREWVLVGLAEGSVGHRVVSDNASEYLAQGGEEGYFEDGRLAFYAKGRVKGEYLLTLAYDTRRAAQVGGANLAQVVDPNAYYLLYGDASEQGHDAASRRNLYLRLERQQFYALFGDFDSGLTYTELGRYSRRLTGAKSEYKGERLEYTAFATQDAQRHQRDQLAGDGTSGPYRLAHRPLLVNSERVVIEVRDRFRSERVLERRELDRFTDYSIDYLAGTLFMKAPVPNRDPAFNPVYLVVEYETQTATRGDLSGGGRVATRLADGRVEVGATAIREANEGAEGDLFAADLRVKLAPGTELRAEVASSDTLNTGVASAGQAHLAELEHQGERVTGRIYLREQETGFGLGQQSNGERGTRKVGVEGTLHLDAELSVEGRAYQQESLATGAEQQVAEAAVRWTDTQGDWSGTAGLRRAEEDTAVSSSLSEQMFAGGSLRLNEHVGLRASAELGLGTAAATDFPDRYVVGADYKLSDKATFFAEHEVAAGRDYDADMTRIGVKSAPWDKASIDTSLTQQVNENGPRTFATLGLTQGWQASESLLLDFGVDRVQTLRHPGPVPFNPNVPPASGSGAPSGDFTTYHVGATWRVDDISIASRYERLRGDAEDRDGFMINGLRQASAALGYSLGLSWLDAETTAGAQNTTANARLGIVWRPQQAEWIVLERLDLVFSEQAGPLDPQVTNWKLINNLDANWRPDARWEVQLQHGLKLNRTRLDREYSSVTDLVAMDARYDLDARWDVGFNAGVLHSWRTDVYDYGFGVSVGYNLAANMWVSLGYNLDGYYDTDFDGARYAAHGLYLKFRIKFDQDSLKQLMRFDLSDPTPSAAPEARR